jgi:hypothetical protein
MKLQNGFRQENTDRMQAHMPLRKDRLRLLNVINTKSTLYAHGF